MKTKQKPKSKSGKLYASVTKIGFVSGF